MKSFTQPRAVGLLPTYHLLVRSQSDFAYSSTEAQLECHLQRIVSLRDEGRIGVSGSGVAFDDGHASQFRYGVPLLEKYGIKGIFFSVAGWVDRRADSMTTAQLREVVSLGHEVQSHGFSHCMLTRCSEMELATELQDSRAELEQKIGVRVDAISLPFGRWDARVLDACAIAGYRRVYTSEPLPAALRPEQLAVLGRFMVRRSTTAQGIERMLLAQLKTLRVMQAVHRCKWAARAVIGEDLYHHLWGIAASRRTLDEVRGEYEPEPGPR